MSSEAPITTTMANDDDIDREWKPSVRPQSTMARSFSLALNDLFKIDSDLVDLDATVSEKKKEINSKSSELEQLEARLKATEERLKLAASGSPPAKTPARSNSGRGSAQQRSPLGDTFAARNQPSSPLADEFRRPNTAKQTTDGKQPVYTVPPMPGALPPTPGASEGESEPEYVKVEARNSADSWKDGDIPPQN